MNQLEQELVKNASSRNIEEKILRDMLVSCNYLMDNFKYEAQGFVNFMEMFRELNRMQQQWLKDAYFMSKKPVLAICMKSNMGNSNEVAAKMFDFMLAHGFTFNRADKAWLEKNNWFAFRGIEPIGEIYEITWYYPLNKWAKQVNTKISQLCGKKNFSLYVVDYPSEKLNNALNEHFHRLPDRLKSLVLRDASVEKMKNINKNTETKLKKIININEFEFFKKIKN